MTAQYRYPGTKSFSTEEQSIFFGRDEDIDKLYTSVVVNPTTVLFGKSGTGKSSIIQAGLIPKLQAIKGEEDDSEPYFLVEVMPKPHEDNKNLWQEIRDIIVKKLGNEINFLEIEELQTSLSLWYLLKAFQYRQALENKQQTVLLLFDQAEELFTYFDSEVEEFVEQLHPVVGQFVPENIQKIISQKFSRLPTGIMKILYSPLPVKLLFSLRSDKLHLITRLKKASPHILHNSFELLPLTQQQAFESIDKPADAAGDFISKKFEITQEAKEYIFKELVANQNVSEGNFEKERVDSFSLQIICSHIEKKVILEKIRTIGKAELENPQKIINNYYKECINGLIVSEDERENVRNLIEIMLLSNDHRIPVHEDFIIGQAAKYLLKRETLNELVNLRLLKKDFNISGGWMYEITHDSFIKPILEAKNERLGKPLDDKTNETIEELKAQIQNKERGLVLENGQEKPSSNIKAGSDKGKLSKAPDNVSKSVWLDSELFDLYKRLGDAYYVIKDFENAIAYFTKALKMPNQNNNSFFIEVYRARADSFFYKNELDASSADLKTILELDPNDYTAIKYLVDNYEMQNKLDEAVAFISTGSNFIYQAPFYNEIGNRYLNRHQYPEAKDYYLKALAIDNSLHYAYRNLGLVEETTGNKDSALNYYQDSLRLRVSAEIYNDIGNLYYSRSEFDNAAANYSLAIKFDLNFYFAIFNLGLVEENRGNWKKAVELYHKVIELDSKYEDAYIRLAGIYYDRKDYRHAKKTYTKLIAISPRKENYYDAGLVEEAMENWDAAMENFKKAIELDSKYEDAYTRLAVIYFNRKDYPHAKEIYAKLIALNPQKENYHDAGLIDEAMEDWGAAVENFKKAIELDSKYEDAYTRLAGIYFHRKDYPHAKEIYAKLIALNPQKRNYYDSGLVDEAMEDWKAAVENFTRAIELDSKYEDAYIGLAGIYFKREDYPHAKEIYAKLIALNPQKENYHDAGLVDEAMEDWDAAVENFKKAIELDSKYEDAYIRLAGIYFKREDYPHAKEIYAKLIALNPQKENYYDAGFIDEAMEDWGAAAENFKKAIELDSKYEDAYIKLAGIYFKREDYPHAKEIYAELIALNPQKENYYEAGLVDEAMEDWGAAVENFKRAIELDSKYEDAYIRLAGIYFKREDYPHAKEIYAKLIALNPQKENYYDGGLVDEAMEDWGAAAENFKRAIELDSKYEDAYIRLAGIYDYKKDVGKAIEFYTKYLELAPENKIEVYTVTNSLGLLYRRINDKKLALKYFKKATELEADDYYLLPLTGISILFGEENKKQQSTAEFSRVLEIYRTKEIDPEILNLAAWELYLANFHLDAAEEMARAAYQKKPESENILQTFAAILVRQDKWRESVDHIRNWLPLVEKKRLIVGWTDFALMFSDIIKNNHQKEMVKMLTIKHDEDIWQCLSRAFLKTIDSESTIVLSNENLRVSDSLYRQLIDKDMIAEFPK